jgi:hypothetical protein
MVTLLGLGLIALSAGLLWSHWRSRHRGMHAGQFRRRILTSGLMGVLGAAIISGQLIVASTRPLAFMLFWLAVLAMTAVLGLSGAVEFLATRSIARRHAKEHAIEMQRLKQDLAAAKERQAALAHRENGKSRKA